MSQNNKDLYRKLQQHLDKMPVGYPATESGVEIRILESLFTPAQAKMALFLGFIALPLRKIYRKARKNVESEEELEKLLDEMYFDGLINRGVVNENGKEVKYYAVAPIAIGFFEYQLKNLNKEFIKLIDQYFKEAFIEEYNKTGIPQLRTIPIEESVESSNSIASYDEFRQVIEDCGEPIAVADCICRKEKDLIGEPCEKTDLREICFSFRTAADVYVEKDLGRYISKETALELLEQAEKDGLILQPGNSQRPMCICCCCGCCCGIVSNQKRYEAPAKFFATNFYAEVDTDLCIGCGICEERCNMDAVEIIDEISHINLNRCIGCGVCVPTCPEDAIKLVNKKDEKIPPRNTIATYQAIMNEKANLARMEKKN
ncbi:MAG: 4Fe-4S ferredoxin [Candidatus Lokiarchaeota archaeon]|nr:4Fe-4S ferredoxin [Candidatus Lokiarchaeota archaeon]MBD3199650.1 4Fe-4S ferredoxin [Candidatus Lokiarchaeota archaeon]